MSSLDDELAEIESQNAYGGAISNYATSNKRTSPNNHRSQQAASVTSPTSLNGGGGAGTATTSSGVAKVKASQLKSTGRGRRGSGDFKHDANGGGPTGAPAGSKLPMSAYINPNMTPQQQAALQAMLERNPALAKYAPPGAFAPPSGGGASTSQMMGGSQRVIGNSSAQSPSTNFGGSMRTITSDRPPPQAMKMGGGGPPGTLKMGAPGQNARGSDLLVGWGQSADDEESDEDVYKPPVPKKMGQSAPPPTIRPGGSAAPRDAIGGQQAPKAPESQKTTQENLKGKSNYRTGDDNDDDDEGGVAYRPTVDAMARGGEAERIMKKQNEMYDLQMPAHRTYVGGFAAAAYETAREYHYIQKAEERAAEDSKNKLKLRDKRPPPSI